MNIKNKIIAVVMVATLALPAISFAQTVNVTQNGMPAITGLPTSTADLQALLLSLLAQLQTLEAQVQSQQGAGSGNGTGTIGLPPGLVNIGSWLNPSSTPSSTVSSTPIGFRNPWCHIFNVNLGFGAGGAEVAALQAALLADGENVTTTATFDPQTQYAVTAFQNKYASSVLAPFGLTAGTGFVGAGTRGLLNRIFGCGNGKPPVGNAPSSTSSSTPPRPMPPIFGFPFPTSTPSGTPNVMPTGTPGGHFPPPLPPHPIVPPPHTPSTSTGTPPGAPVM
jgi:hypothetical protein